MNHSTGKPTKADQARFRKLQEHGCAVMRFFYQQYEPPDIHHLLSGGRRISHQHTIPLSIWFHRGIPPEGIGIGRMRKLYGPSLALEKKAFIERFGTEAELLTRVNKAIA